VAAEEAAQRRNGMMGRDKTTRKQTRSKKIKYEQFEQISLHFDVNAQMIDIGKAYEKSVWIPSPET
jgi:hypothetical protein